MNPWLIYWAPQLHLPFGGNVAQRIEPNVTWFFDAIDARAGDSKIERKAFEVASYGRQLGLITELLLDISKDTPPQSSKGKEALRRITEISEEIEGLKKRDADEITSEVEQLIARLKTSHKDAFPRLRGQIERALDAAVVPEPERVIEAVPQAAPPKLAAPKRDKRKG